MAIACGGDQDIVDMDRQSLEFAAGFDCEKQLSLAQDLSGLKPEFWKDQLQESVAYDEMLAWEIEDPYELLQQDLASLSLVA